MGFPVVPPDKGFPVFTVICLESSIHLVVRCSYDSVKCGARSAMPKQKPTVEEWIKDYKELKYERNKVFCQSCSKTINCDKKYYITQHVKTSLHQRKLKLTKNQTMKQQTIGTALQSVASNSSYTSQSKFNFDLCKALIKANIPIYKLKNKYFKTFLETYCAMQIPDESHLRKNYISSVYKEVIQEIKNIIGNNCIWICVDETTDVCGRYVANLILGVLNDENSSKSFLITTKELSKTNNNTITRFIHEELTHFFLPEPVPSDKILLMLSDAAAYMVKAASNLKIFYPNLIHCTCLAHGLNRVAETIRLQFPLVNKLITCGKQIFLKAPLRVEMFRDRLPNTPLPPQPVLTRWGTWLDAAIYYTNTFESFKKLINEFPATASKAIQDCQAVIKEVELQNNLAFIKTNYSYVSDSIKSIEKQDLSLVTAVQIIKNFQDSTYIVLGHIGQIITNKLNDVLSKNEGFNTLQKIASILNGEIVPDFIMDPALITKFKYAPITSVDVERSFSAYKNMLSDRRHNFTMEHLEQHLIISCFRD